MIKSSRELKSKNLIKKKISFFLSGKNFIPD